MRVKDACSGLLETRRQAEFAAVTIEGGKATRPKQQRVITCEFSQRKLGRRGRPLAESDSGRLKRSD